MLHCYEHNDINHYFVESGESTLLLTFGEKGAYFTNRSPEDRCAEHEGLRRARGSPLASPAFPSLLSAGSASWLPGLGEALSCSASAGSTPSPLQSAGKGSKKSFLH